MLPEAEEEDILEIKQDPFSFDGCIALEQKFDLEIQIACNRKGYNYVHDTV